MKNFSFFFVILYGFVFQIEGQNPLLPANSDFCWQESFGRGVGTPMTCPPGKVYDAGLCYFPCKAGFTGVGPVCWANCPANFTDRGVFCSKPSSYGRGAGSITQCHNCEKNGLLWYPKCAAGFFAAGCCVCSPVCPPNTTDAGATCTKVSYGRGVGTPVDGCPVGKEKQGLLCYTICRTGFTGVGPVCWSNTCPGKYAVKCNAGCAQTAEACARNTNDQVREPIQFVGFLVNSALSGKVRNATKSSVIEIKQDLLEEATALGLTLSTSQLQNAAEMTHDAQGFTLWEDFKRLDPSHITHTIQAYAKPLCVNVK